MKKNQSNRVNLFSPVKIFYSIYSIRKSWLWNRCWAWNKCWGGCYICRLWSEFTYLNCFGQHSIRAVQNRRDNLISVRKPDQVYTLKICQEFVLKCIQSSIIFLFNFLVRSLLLIRIQVSRLFRKGPGETVLKPSR